MIVVSFYLLLNGDAMNSARVGKWLPVGISCFGSEVFANADAVGIEVAKLAA